MGREEKLIQVVRQSLKAVHRGSQPLVLVGLSGGVDSMALLGAMTSLVDAGTVRASVVHVDHAVRGESATEAAEVTAFARSLGFEVFAKRLDEDVMRLYPRVGLEEAMRRGRYLALYEVFQASGADLVALAHHQQDQAETVLMHILRGAGMRGAGGMRQYSRIAVPWWPVRQPDGSEVIAGEHRERMPLWRPFLQTRKAELQAFVTRRGYPVWEDPSNDNREFRRNAIRHDVLPLLEEIYPGSAATLARFGQILGEDNDELDALARVALGDHAGDMTVPRDVLRGQSVVIRRRMIRLWILDRVPGLDVSFGRVQAVSEAVEWAGSGVVIEIGEGWSVAIGRDRVVLDSGGF